MIPTTEPTSTARSTLWIASNSAGELAQLLGAHVSHSSARSARSALALGAVGGRDALVERDDPRVVARRACSTSRANTTAAAGAPPITDACAPSSAIDSKSSFSRCENTTNAPPW